jgi:thiamine kinase-like enzyme
VIRVRDGGVRLVDWDTTMMAPRERDLRMVLDEERTGWDEYRAEVGPVSLNGQALELYGLRWDLTDIAIYVSGFRRAHELTDDTAACWKHLSGYLARL